MPAPVVRVEGADRLRATMRAAGLTAAAAPSTPRRTGVLATSIRPSGTARGAFARSRLVYAPVIHFGWPGHNIAAQPWLYDAAVATQPEWQTYYEDEIDKLLDSIHGAT